MECEQKRTMSQNSENDSDECVAVAYLGNAGHTCPDLSSGSSPGKKRKKIIKRHKKVKKDSNHGHSSDSSVEVIDVKLPYQDEINQEIDKPTQETKYIGNVE